MAVAESEEILSLCYHCVSCITFSKLFKLIKQLTTPRHKSPNVSDFVFDSDTFAWFFADKII